MRHRTWGPPEETWGTVCGGHLGRHPEQPEAREETKLFWMQGEQADVGLDALCGADY